MPPGPKSNLQKVTINLTKIVVVELKRMAKKEKMPWQTFAREFLDAAVGRTVAVMPTVAAVPVATMVTTPATAVTAPTTMTPTAAPAPTEPFDPLFDDPS